MIGSGRGGGGGFGSFPYRSSHQQGQDGPNQGRGGGNRRRGGGRNRNRPRRNNFNSSFQAQLDVPPEQRGILVGKCAATLKWLNELSGECNVFIPQRDDRQSHDANTNSSSSHHQQHPIRVNSSDMPSLLHVLYEISHLLKQLDFGSEYIDCTVKMRTRSNDNNTTLDGRLFVSRDTSSKCMFSSINQSIDQFRVYTIATTLDAQNISTIVDNVRFVNSRIVDKCQWFCRGAQYYRNNTTSDGYESTRSLIFVFGSDSDNPEQMNEAIGEAIDESFRSKLCM